MSPKVLLVDDDPEILLIVQGILKQESIDTVTAADGKSAIARMQDELPSAIVLDLLLPDTSGKTLLERFQREHPSIPIVILSSQGDVEEVVECMRLGAVDFVQKPVDRTRLLTTVKNAHTQGVLKARVELLAQELRHGQGFDQIIGESKAIVRCVQLLQRAAKSEITVLLQGESGTGKEVAARAIHAESSRRTGPFVAVNCGAIPENLIESELFGHEKGSFTGAHQTRIGRFEQAEGGTIFLDEIGELRLDLQVRLLRVLQERKVQRVGSSLARPINIRVLAATNRDLKAQIDARAFRRDLYYRLAVFPVELPPLRQREGDILLLASAFLRRFAERHDREIKALTPAARRALFAYPWPGNVRELENVIERATILEDGAKLSLGSLPDEVVCAGESPVKGTSGASVPLDKAEIIPLEDEERRIIQRALDLTGWNVQEAAQRLKIGRATIYRKIERYGLKNRPS